MTISKVEPDLRQIIQSLRDGNLEKAKDRTVELIESAFRMSGPMYREERPRGRDRNWIGPRITERPES